MQNIFPPKHAAFTVPGVADKVGLRSVPGVRANKKEGTKGVCVRQPGY